MLLTIQFRYRIADNEYTTINQSDQANSGKFPIDAEHPEQIKKSNYFSMYIIILVPAAEGATATLLTK